MEPASSYGAPVIVLEDGHLMPLSRVSLGSADHAGGEREAFIQKLVYDHPEIIPMVDIAPPFVPLISICKELPTSAGYLDNLWITPDGGVVLGECKLFRNSQARREVIVQALHYAQAIAGLNYEEFEGAIRIALKSPSITLWGMLKEQSPLDEAQFVDAISRRLRQSHLMVLIIGDGIREGAESLTTYLQLHAGLHVGLALVDLSIWRDTEGRLLIVQSVPLHSVLIELGIVTINAAGEPTVQPPKDKETLAASTSPKVFTISEQEYFDQLQQRQPGLDARLRQFLSDVSDLGVFPEFRKSLVLRWNASPDFAASPGFIETNGKVWLTSAWGAANRLGRPEAGIRYLNTIAKFVGGQLRASKYQPDVSGPDDRQVVLGALLKSPGLWKAAIAQLIEDLRPQQADGT